MKRSGINLGRVTFIPRGQYDPKATYHYLDVVHYAGCGYVVKKTCTGVTPQDGEFYMLWVGTLGTQPEISMTITKQPDKLVYRRSSISGDMINPDGMELAVVLNAAGVRISTNLIVDFSGPLHENGEYIGYFESVSEKVTYPDITPVITVGPIGRLLVPDDEVMTVHLQYGAKSVDLTVPIKVNFEYPTFGEVASLNMTWQELADNYGPTWLDICELKGYEGYRPEE